MSAHTPTSRTGRPALAARRIVLGLLPFGLLAGALQALAAHLATRILRVRRAPSYHQRLLAVAADEVVLARDRAAELPGTYGLAWPGGHAVIGEVTRTDEATVTRPLLRVQQGALALGPCRLDHVDIGDPGRAFDMAFEEVQLRSDVGELPAWVVPGRRRDAWVVLAHGYGGSLQSALSFLPALHERDYTSLVVSYRNDPGAPPSADHRHHLGVSEWRDVDAGIAHALSSGARRIVLFGWSMGGAVVLQAASRSEHRSAIAGLVLDCPVLDWRVAIGHVARRQKVPVPFLSWVLRLVERRIGARFDELDWVARSAELDRPILLFHGGQDGLVPPPPSLELARRRPDLVRLVLDGRAGHVGSFNVDPRAYGRALGDFLAAVMLEETSEPADGAPGPID